MGCKGSKHKSPAGDIAVSPRKKSELLTDTPAPAPAPAPDHEVFPVMEVAAAGSDSVKDNEVIPVMEVAAAGSDSVKDNEVIPVIEVAAAASDSVKEVKDITTNTEASEKAPVEERQVGALISGESPDRYFSSRKEEERINSIAAEGGAYYSPRYEAGHGGKKEEDAQVPRAVEEGQKENIQPCKQEKENAASEEHGNAGESNKAEIGVKEHIFIEDTAEVSRAVEVTSEVSRAVEDTEEVTQAVEDTAEETRAAEDQTK
ncbi:uncharacterized protein [Aristolochia californica]|uniref:uncharacterized protein n=1 Tax=Aristolochia californica TaxID=171875 RepID=UPI0035E3312D